MQTESLFKLFQNRIFRIPDYQRGYAWGDKQILDLWRDLNLLTDGKQHFTGAITVKNITSSRKKIECEEQYWLDENDYKEFYVIDGQQRLTTLIIFISRIVSLAEERKLDSFGETDDQLIKNVKKHFIYDQLNKGIRKCIKFCYDETDENNRKCFLNDILKIDSSLQYNITLYTKHLKEANEIIKGLLGKLTNDKLKKIYKTITRNLVFEFREINSQDNECLFDENEMFETMNNRGKDLSDLELLKNRLIYLTIFFDGKEGNQVLRNDINCAWKTIYENLGKNSQSILSDDDYLKFHYSYYYNDINRDTAKVYRDRLFINTFSVDKLKNLNIDIIKKHTDQYYSIDDLDDEDDSIELNNEDKGIDTSSNDDKKLTINDISEYVKNISMVSGIWFKINNPEYTGVIENEIEKKFLIRFKRLKQGKELFLPIIASIYERETSTEDRIKVLRSIERYVFIYFFLFRIGKGYKINKTTNQRNFYDLAYNYRNETINIEEVLNNVDTKLNEILERKNNVYDIYESLGDDGFYNWRGLHYLLFEYEEYLYLEKGGKEPISWDSFVSKDNDLISIEHIYPQTPETEKRPDDADYWNKQFINDSEELKVNCNRSLGNLLLLSMKKNRIYQNFKLEKKINGWKNDDGGTVVPGYKDGSHSEREISNLCLQNLEWNKKYIYDRGIKILNYVEKRWNISLGTEEFKSKFLLLDSIYAQNGYSIFDTRINEEIVAKQIE